MIYQLFTGRYIDLSKLVSVSEVSIGDLTIRFELTIQLLEQPIIIAINSSGRLIQSNGRMGDKYVEDIYKEREIILKDWKEFLMKTPTSNG